MLVLTRRLDESIILPNCETSVTVLRIAGGRVQLGIRAPQYVNIYRQEVWDRIIETGACEVTVVTEPNRSVPLLPK